MKNLIALFAIPFFLAVATALSVCFNFPAWLMGCLFIGSFSLGIYYKAQMDLYNSEMVASLKELQKQADERARRISEANKHYWKQVAAGEFDP